MISEDETKLVNKTVTETKSQPKRLQIKQPKSSGTVQNKEISSSSSSSSSSSVDTIVTLPIQTPITLKPTIKSNTLRKRRLLKKSKLSSQELLSQPDLTQQVAPLCIPESLVLKFDTPKIKKRKTMVKKRRKEITETIPVDKKSEPLTSLMKLTDEIKHQTPISSSSSSSSSPSQSKLLEATRTESLSSTLLQLGISEPSIQDPAHIFQSLSSSTSLQLYTDPLISSLPRSVVIKLSFFVVVVVDLLWYLFLFFFFFNSKL